MTGFGRASKNTKWGALIAEIKSVNNRFLEIQIRLPRIFSNAELAARNFVAEKMVRGSVSVNLHFQGSDQGNGSSSKWDAASMRPLVAQLGKLKKTLDLKGEITLDTLARFEGFFKKEISEIDEKVAWAACKPVLAEAIEKAEITRKREGKNLEKSMEKHLAECSAALARTQRQMPLRLDRYAEKLKSRIQEMTAGIALDQGRMQMEIALMADRMDIHEECDRFDSHIIEFRKAIKSPEPQGKRMNFILQEMNREANTIGSKANDSEISRESMVLKEKIEIIREQIQNML